MPMTKISRAACLFVAIAGLSPWSPAATGAEPAKDCIQGTVRMSDSLSGKLKPGATLFVYAREVGRSKGAPTVVASVKDPSYPQAFTLCPANQMLPGTTPKPLSAAYRVYARHSETGKPMVNEGFAGSTAGAKGTGIKAGEAAQVLIVRTLGKAK